MARGYFEFSEGIMNCGFVGEAVRELIKSKLTSLDLSMGCLNDSDLDAMVAASAAFKKLEHLNDNGRTPASEPKIKVLAKNAQYGKDQDPERAKDGHYRSVSVSE